MEDYHGIREEELRSLGVPLCLYIPAQEMQDFRDGGIEGVVDRIESLSSVPPLNEEPRGHLLYVVHFLTGEWGVVQRVVFVATTRLMRADPSVFLDWKYHGRPCELQSTKRGGSAYPDITKEQWEKLKKERPGLARLEDPENRLSLWGF